MEVVWSSYGNPMEFLWSTTVAPPYHHPCPAPATRSPHAHSPEPVWWSSVPVHVRPCLSMTVQLLLHPTSLARGRLDSAALA